MANGQSIILHQYEASPFAEKVRLALRLKNLAWSSVDIPTIMPKPDLMPLTGGYRRTPIMQIGADIFCDTALILKKLEQRFPEPPLINAGQEGTHSMIASWTDRQWFPLSVGIVFGSNADRIPEALRQDREAMTGRTYGGDELVAKLPMLKDQWRAHFSLLEERLTAGRGAGAGSWLFGSKPGMSDVHAHMNVWFVSRNVPDFAKACLREAPRVQDWYDRLIEIKGQDAESLTGEDALDISRHSAPRLLAASTGTEPQGLRPGDRVAISPDDTAPCWVEGELVSAQPNQITLQKVKNAISTLHIHFPRAGYLVKKLNSDEA
ncbi:MAG: glutathione S-transferase [Ponticaulis sp.]|nr:glutathione S-transferase [Ponticaulis sp.]|tara:strand:- start:66525 stop:67487 length:963 start_codon:yes stop_codon:yes gene_type:complete